MERALSEYLAEVRRSVPRRGETSSLEHTQPITEDRSDYRPLNSEEMAILSWLLERGEPVVREFLAQLPFTLARSGCSCGCPTIALRQSSQVEPIPKAPRILAEYFGRVDGHLVGMMLWNAGGWLSQLEVYDVEGLDRSFGLPAIETLQEWKPQESA